MAYQQYTEFVFQLIKGKITETIFKAMISESEKYTVIPAGYEHTLPMLAQYRKQVPNSKSLETMRKSPDFILISKDKEETLFVEVKYRSKLNIAELIETSEELVKNWSDAYLFVATPEAFYFDCCTHIIENAHMLKMSPLLVSSEKHEEYLEMLNRYV